MRISLTCGGHVHQVQAWGSGARTHERRESDAQGKGILTKDQAVEIAKRHVAHGPNELGDPAGATLRREYWFTGRRVWYVEWSRTRLFQVSVDIDAETGQVGLVEEKYWGDWGAR